MKLIINISEDYYEIIKHHVDNHLLDYRPCEIIANGIPLDVVIENMRIKKEDILHHFQDINFYYNDCMMYADLNGMLDELISESEEPDGKKA